MYGDKRHTLDCQDCGEVLRELTLAEAQLVAANPHNYIVYCRECGFERAKDIERDGFIP